jgi:hypothetical protein
VQRVDQNKASAVPGRRPHGEVGEIRQIAYAPGLLRTHAVELSGQAPGPARAQSGGQFERCGRHDDRTADVEGADLKVQPVISERQVAGQLEGGLADPSAVEIVWSPVVFELSQAGSYRAVLQPDPQAHRIAVSDVHPER